PLGPTKDTNCPAEMAKLTSRNASTATVPRRVRNTFRTFSISIASAHAPARLRLGRDSVPGMNSPGYLCVVGAGIVICYLFPLCAVDCGVRKDELRHPQHAIDPPWFAWTRPTHRAVARGKKFVLAAQPRQVAAARKRLFRGNAAPRSVGRCHGLFIGIQPIRAGWSDHVAAAHVATERGVVQHRGELTRVCILADRPEQDATGEHDHTVAGGQMLLRAVDDRVHGLLDRLILERNAEDAGEAIAPALHVAVEPMIVGLVLDRAPATHPI